ncbi:glycosyl transferase group 1 [Novosphingobium nitrogenifigens DSM 19370]|uniref:Glycosyl transferase group 1 n=1 Tax=Novosphingobium nitrogenifigens DSM 19370 TaxID=983920 RepID=F1ZDV7_9SPHN|nr:glycosyltransferase family 4 protein [Novosphingobium nitrogenifigens]EGD57206.1 glycosyl transferase group 1 [Novosphingobium nitrogenifigens DSM 19370]
MTGKAKPVRLAIVVSHPIQYYVPLYQRLARDPDIALKVFYMSDISIRGGFDPGFGGEVKWNIDLLEGYDHEFVGKHYRSINPNRFTATVVPELFGKILQGRFDAVLLNGYAQAGNLFALAGALLSRTKVLVRSDSNAELLAGKPQRLPKRLYVKGFFAACHRMLVSGQRNRDFYRYWGVPDRKLILAPFTVDNDRFYRDSRLDADACAALRHSLGCPDDRPILLFASKFVRRKQPDLTIRAAGELARAGHRLHLVMAGSGEMDEELRAIAAEYPELSIHFTGFVNQAEMPPLLGAADVFVFPSTGEPWGLIVNEAMAAGLPVIVGDDSGCAPDLVEPGVNGYLTQARDLDSIRRAIEPLVADAGLRASMAQASLNRISRWSLRETVEGVRQALGLSRA